MPRLVIDFQDRRPLWRPPDRALARIREALPADWQAVTIRAAVDGSADGAGAASPEALAAVADAEVYLGMGIPAEILRAGPGLRWVHSATAGVGGSLSPEMLDRDVVFTNSAGVHSPPMAETVLGMMLHFARGLDAAVRARARGEWDAGWFHGGDSPVRELGRSTVGVIGYGGVGRAVAAHAAALGARVLALKRSPAEAPDGIELLYGRGGLDRLLAESDYLVLTVPETPQTRGLIDDAALEAVKPGAVLVNVARGGVLDEDALVRALDDGRLRGAALDVFAAEPLPPEHPFWRLPNVLLTPHVSATTPHFWERQTALIVDNLRRYLDGRPLRNVVDKRAGY